MHTMAWGERTSIAQRELGAGYDHTDFENCPDALVDGLETECSSCHTTCGQCHVSRPESVHGGFIDSHRFNRTPDQNNNCMACHGSRIAVDFKGSLSGNRPDVHYLNAMKCFDCHTEDMHADASMTESRYHLADLPTCTDAGCHIPDSGADLPVANQWHSVHWPDENGNGLSCFVCHSQPYNNCNTCHTAGEWKEGYAQVGDSDIHTGGGGYIEYPDFRIGYNYNKNLHDGEWIVVRHIPVSRDSYSNWGHDVLDSYDDRPVWEYSSPHNIRLFTAQTDTSDGATCSENCHVTGAKAAENSERYLWRSYISSEFSDEIIANDPVTVDDHVPSGWTKY